MDVVQCVPIPSTETETAPNFQAQQVIARAPTTIAEVIEWMYHRRARANVARLSMKCEEGEGEGEGEGWSIFHFPRCPRKSVSSSLLFALSLSA